MYYIHTMYYISDRAKRGEQIVLYSSSISSTAPKRGGNFTNKLEGLNMHIVEYWLLNYIELLYELQSLVYDVLHL